MIKSVINNESNKDNALLCDCQYRCIYDSANIHMNIKPTS